MRVVLLAPCNPAMTDPRIAPPLGLLNLVAWARQEGHDTSDWQVIDLNTECYQPDAPKGHQTHDFSLERCMAEIPRGADVYGLSLASMQYPHGVAIAKELRKRDPGALLVCGGSHASALPEECLEFFDAVVTQEGEAAFMEVLADQAERINSGYAGSALPAIYKGVPVEPLDSLPMPARDMLDWSKYTRKIAGEPATNIISSRGCVARCNFCQQSSLWSDKPMRSMTSPRILAEVDHIYETTGIRHLLFLDDSLTARKRSEMEALCHGLRERGVLWRGWTRANLCVRKRDAETLRLMAESGCQAICIGVEAGSDKVLKAMDKGTTVAMNSAAVKAVAASGMDCRVSIMVGNPRETWEDVEALVAFVEAHRDYVSDWILSSYVPLPGTPSWDDPERYGLIIDKAKARRDQYRHFYVVGGNERSPFVHAYTDGTGPEDIELRHRYVQEMLLRLCPRERKRVTMGEAA